MAVIWLSLVPVLSCTSQVRELDLKTKAVIRVNFVSEIEETREKRRPTKVYLKKLDDQNDIMKGKIISTDIKDDNGNFLINYEPGTYLVVAIMRHGDS